jgi:carboxyl-terminal processing protease
MPQEKTSTAWIAISLIALILAGCGGGGGASGNVSSVSGSAALANQCDPANPLAAAGLKIASLTTEKQWIRSYFNEAYLWYNEIPAVDANASNFSLPMTQLDGRGVPASLSNYFSALKTPAVTASGARRDQFSFTFSTAEWNKLSQSGVEFGYGVQWAFISTEPPRKLIVAYTEPNTSASSNNVLRGAEVLAIDGEDFVNGRNVNKINAGLLPATSGEQHQFNLRDTNGTTRTVTLTSGDITKTPVQNVKTIDTANGKVGYLTFNDHIATAEQQLINAVNTLKAANINDLVIDLRYNGGGYLYIASALSYMIAGPNATTGKNFETTRYNDKRAADNDTTPFYNTSCILNTSFQCTKEQPLPTLNLSKVYVLVSGDTCSASEAIINSLRGVDVDVRLIGSTTCGKPYGFTAKDNCGISYFPIEFQGVNHKGFGDYSDGFVPGTGTLPTNVPGCLASDDFTKPLGDATEGMLATALSYRSSNSCPSTALNGKTDAAAAQQPSAVLVRTPLRENRFKLPRG